MKTKIFTTLLVQTLLAVIVGFLVSIIANLFIEGARFLLSLQTATSTLSIQFLNTKVTLLPIFAMFVSATLIILVRKTLGVTKWSGPADSIYALHQQKIGVDIKLGLGSTLAAFISAGGGASVGQYGPLIHFGATLSTMLSRIFGAQISKDVLIACGVAAAISAGFNAPIAGILFAHEALLRRFSIGAVAPISVAAIVASASNQYLGFSNLAFTVPIPDIELAAVVPFVILFAPICSAAAIVYMLTLRKFQRFAASGKFSFNSLIFTTALVVGVVGVFLPDVLGLGGPQMNKMVNGEYSIQFLAILFFAKIVITAACVSFGFFGGIFGPALFVGAALGAILAGLLIQVGLPSDYGSIIAVATLAAVGSSVIGAPLTAVLIVVELTGSYEYGLMALLSVTLCSNLTYRFFGLSFFDRQLLDRGIDLTRGREHIHMTQLYMSEVQLSDCLTFPKGVSAGEILEAMREAQTTESYILNTDGSLHGKLDLHVLISSQDDFENQLDTNPISLETKNSLTESLEIASDFVGESIPVIEDGLFVGAITEGDLFKKVLEVEESLRGEGTLK
jgi:CIC family chloride channel protein